MTADTNDFNLPHLHLVPPLGWP